MTRAAVTLWDDGVLWSTRRTVAPTQLPMRTEYVYDQVLRGACEDADEEFVTNAIRAFADDAEHETQRALMPQTWEMVLDGFPASGQIVLQRPPLIAVTSLQYYDADNELQDLAVSPAEFAVVPSGRYTKAIVRPIDGESFPSTYGRPDAVTVTYEAGYEDVNDPELAKINIGIALAVGEFYKLRSLSVQGLNYTPAVLQTSRFWTKVRG